MANLFYFQSEEKKNIERERASSLLESWLEGLDEKYHKDLIEVINGGLALVKGYNLRKIIRKVKAYIDKRNAQGEALQGCGGCAFPHGLYSLENPFAKHIQKYTHKNKSKS
jgi:hypothetical protein